MRRVAGVFPHHVHPTTTVAALILAAVLAAAALYIGDKAAAYLPDPITTSSWQPPRLTRDDAALEPSQSSNRAKKAAREPFRVEARLAPDIAAPEPAEANSAEPKPDDTVEENGTAAETGRASWYDLNSKTASGEAMDGDALTAAHRTLPLGTRVRVANLDNGRAVVVRINDRGPFAKDRIIDLSKAAAARLGMIADGVANVAVTPVAGDVANNVGAETR